MAPSQAVAREQRSQAEELRGPFSLHRRTDLPRILNIIQFSLVTFRWEAEDQRSAGLHR